MVLFSSTINATIRSTTDLVILCHADEREIVPLPKSYQDAIDTAREVFGLGGNAELILKTSDPDACRGRLAVINKRAWDSLRSVLANIEVEVKDEQQRSTSRVAAGSTHSAGGSESDVDENEDFLVLKPSKSSLKGKARSATEDEEKTSSSAVGGASETGSWRGTSSGPSETAEEEPDPRSSMRERQLRIEKLAKAATKSESSRDRKATPAHDSAQSTSTADQDAPPRSQPVQVKQEKQEKPAVDLVPSSSKRNVSGQGHTTNEDYPSASQQSQPQSQSQSQSQAEGSGSSDKFVITIAHRASGKEALFRTRRNLPVSKVLDTACTQFGLSRRTAKLAIVDANPLWPMVKTSVPCKRDQTMAEVGAKENSRFEIEGEFQEEGSDE